MDIQATKLELIQYLLNTKKESLLLKVKELVLQDEIIGQTGKDETLTSELLNAKLHRAEQDFKAGRVTSDEDLEEEMKSW